ncbi:hypothetical protein Tco_0156156 [Tanacetum coccineum]
MHHHTCNLLPHDQVRLPDTKAKRSPNQLLLNLSPFLRKTCDPEQARRDKDMKKNLALLAKYFKELTMTVAGARETVGSPVVQQNGIQCFNCKGFGHYAGKQSQSGYTHTHKEKMMMCKQAEQGVPLQAEQADWLEDTDEEIDEQELEAHYSYMAKIQEVSPEESSSTGQPLEQITKSLGSNLTNVPSFLYSLEIVQYIQFIVDSDAQEHLRAISSFCVHLGENSGVQFVLETTVCSNTWFMGDLIQGNGTIKRVIMSIGPQSQSLPRYWYNSCDADLENAFQEIYLFL